ncbi:glucose-1-phosphate adenylyltransferase [Bacillus oleivorans]|uniref:Glucose-1-phosphate adenylyltransferase n=1 Tax=Bacillus oleivorans TaxID=1448271 RepID=A0A285CHJ7_9BACI|nr:glucose-1-phosphate adenylyltransferase subunit GlgD [Bacillus oleivorans]SNX66815.1 glucose-1-phosphate adenylyltransferase [Bacillus oleivorans]
MRDVLGVINLMNENQFLKELTTSRCLASVPFGGRYRLIDFTLSDYIHADITQVAVFAKEKYRSLMDHLDSGKEWDLDRHTGGLFILPPLHPGERMRGDLQQFFDHIMFFQRSPADTVIISPGHHICEMDYTDLIDFHNRNNADITVVYKDFNGTPVYKPVYHQCSIDNNENVTDIQLYTTPQTGDLVCLETYCLNKNLLVDLIYRCVENDEYDLLKDAIKANLHYYKVKGYRLPGEMLFMHSMESFYECNMAFLNPKVMQAFFNDKRDVFTKIKHEAPAKYGHCSKVSHSLVANGCEIQGVVENSILFRGVTVQKGAVVKNSIIMQKSVIEEGAYVENVITDKQAKITRDKVIKGPRVIKKAETI